jgi:hypothetical protein
MGQDHGHHFRFHNQLPGQKILCVQGTACWPLEALILADLKIKKFKKISDSYVDISRLILGKESYETEKHFS